MEREWVQCEGIGRWENMLRSKSLTDTGNKKDYTLAIISNYPIEGYLKKGYDYVFSYYNPFGFFKVLHFFEPYYNPLESFRIAHFLKPNGMKTVIRQARVMGKQYTFYIHRTLNYEDVKKVFTKYKIDCIRTYEMFSFDLAEQLSKDLKIPLVVSIH